MSILINNGVIDKPNLVVSSPRRSTRKRKNGTDGDVKIFVGYYYSVEARLDFATGANPKTKESKWCLYKYPNRYAGGTPKLILGMVTKAVAIDEAKKLILEDWDKEKEKEKQ